LLAAAQQYRHAAYAKYPECIQDEGLGLGSRGRVGVVIVGTLLILTAAALVLTAAALVLAGRILALALRLSNCAGEGQCQG
jgi:hypothetical protein